MTLTTRRTVGLCSPWSLQSTTYGKVAGVRQRAIASTGTLAQHTMALLKVNVDVIRFEDFLLEGEGGLVFCLL